MRKRRRARWDALAVKGLRRHLELTQDQLAGELGVRQQTVSEWETGAYRPRGASETLLAIVADRAGFVWGAAAVEAGGEKREAGSADGEHGAPFEKKREARGEKREGRPPPSDADRELEQNLDGR